MQLFAGHAHQTTAAPLKANGCKVLTAFSRIRALQPSFSIKDLK